MSKTEKNLMDAFTGESEANRKYLAFAKQAAKEGHTQNERIENPQTNQVARLRLF